MDLEKSILRKVGEAVTRFKMIRDGDRVAVGFSGGKDSFTLLAPCSPSGNVPRSIFTVCAFTIEQGKFLSPSSPLASGCATAASTGPTTSTTRLRLLAEQPEHGCDVCSRFRRRAVYQIARGLGANVIAFGHTADDFCESFLRNAMFTGRLSALPPSPGPVSAISASSGPSSTSPKI